MLQKYMPINEWVFPETWRLRLSFEDVRSRRCYFTVVFSCQRGLPFTELLPDVCVVDRTADVTLTICVTWILTRNRKGFKKFGKCSKTRYIVSMSLWLFQYVHNNIETINPGHHFNSFLKFFSCSFFYWNWKSIINMTIFYKINKWKLY